MESSLSLSLTDLREAVGFFLGYGRGEGADDSPWSSNQLYSINECIKSGLRQFYFPPVLRGERSSHDWSFMKPVASLTLASGAAVMALPDDFGGADGQLMVAGVGLLGSNVNITSIGEVLNRHQAASSATGRPALACVEPVRDTTASRGQRFQLRVWPTADREYTLSLQYYLLPDALTLANPYPLGGLQHAETIRESCLAIAEQTLDDSITTHSTKFLVALAASVSADRKSKPQNFGYNGDGSDGMMRARAGVPVVTVNGVLY